MPNQGFQQPNNTTLQRRSANAPAPAPMKRQEKPQKLARNPLLDFATREEKLTDVQKQPLTAREKPKPSEAVFPSPRSTKQKIAERPASMPHHAAGTAPAQPMPRHIVTAEELSLHRVKRPE